ncbi:MAG: chromosomal replication initiator protein DnaA [Cyanobacteriota bacterium]
MWEKIVKNLSHQLSQPQYEGWIKPIKFLSADEQNIYLAVPDNFFKNWIKSNLMKNLSIAIKEEIGKDIEIKLEIKPELYDEDKTEYIESSVTSSGEVQTKTYVPHSEHLKKLNKSLNLKYTFDTFVIGPNNRFAYSVAKSVAENPGKSHNPLFIYGGVGLGKTHLMQAIGHYLYSKGLGKIKYTSAESFTNDLIESIRRNTSSDFRSRYRDIDLLLIDDVQFLEGKERTQEEFFNTFNTLYESGKQIVLSSDRPPKKIVGLAERLVSRFEWGIMVDIQAPDLETRVAILKNKAKADKMDIPDAVLELIASAYQNNIRELEGALNRVIAFVGITGCLMNVESVKSLIYSTSKTKTVTPDKIIDLVADYYEISSSDIKGSSRMKTVSQARQVAIYLIREVSQLSFPNIGSIFSKKHSTIIYAYEKMKEEINAKPALSSIISELKSKIT